MVMESDLMLEKELVRMLVELLELRKVRVWGSELGEGEVN